MLHRGYIVLKGQAVKDVSNEEIFVGVSFRNKLYVALRMVSQNTLFVISGTRISIPIFIASFFVILGTTKVISRSSFQELPFVILGTAVRHFKNFRSSFQEPLLE
jgi:hypothetical protein